MPLVIITPLASRIIPISEKNIEFTLYNYLPKVFITFMQKSIGSSSLTLKQGKVLKLDLMHQNLKGKGSDSFIKLTLNIL